MIPPQFQKEIDAALKNMAAKLVETGHATESVVNEASGRGNIKLTEDGIRLSESINKLFGEFRSNPHALKAVDVVALVQILLLP